MTSVWNEPPSRDDRAESGVKPDENQFDMFGAAAPPVAERCGDGQNGDERRRVDTRNIDVPRRGGAEAGGAGSDELQRLEDSIRWLMNESNESNVRHLPRAATLAPVRGLPPVEAEGPDSLLLNPDSIFPPRSSQRRAGVSRGVVKFLLASAVAAPTAYFIANWMQRSGTAAPSAAASVEESFEERMAAVVPVTRRPEVDGARIADEILGPLRVEPAVTRGLSPPETNPVAALDVKAGGAAEVPGLSPGVAAMPFVPVPASPSGAGSEVAAGSPTPSVVPPQSATAQPATSQPAIAKSTRPVVSAQELAALMERGRILFESGDLAAARLFFRRAANTGDAAAALAMGATYDPDVLGKRFIRGIGADPEEARIWYEKARELGSPEGPRRIEMLAHR